MAAPAVRPPPTARLDARHEWGGRPEVARLPFHGGPRARYRCRATR